MLQISYLKPVATNYDKSQQQQHHFPQTFIPQNTRKKIPHSSKHTFPYARKKT